MPDGQNYGLEATQAHTQLDQVNAVPVQSYPHFRHPFQPASAQDQTQGFNGSFDGKIPSPHDIQTRFDQQGRDSFSELSQGHNSNASAKVGTSSVDVSEPPSPISTRGFNARQSNDATPWARRSSNEAGGQQEVKDESDKKPPWSELKTKAGKERKRLPLACIACRRKKIRCSGEKPACKHCLRSRIPCVYKVTTRKAAPRTDYMAMLDKRLKRMEERVIKIIPKEEQIEPTAIPRAVIKPSASSQSSGKKRGAEEAFGPRLEEWAESNTGSQPLKGRTSDESKVNTEGAEHLPSAELQDHLSEVFFDCLYGQSYHLLHKPSYMRRLRYVLASLITSKTDLTDSMLVLALCLLYLFLLCAPYLPASPHTPKSILSLRSCEAKAGHAPLEIFLYVVTMSRISRPSLYIYSLAFTNSEHAKVEEAGCTLAWPLEWRMHFSYIENWTMTLWEGRTTRNLS